MKSMAWIATGMAAAVMYAPAPRAAQALDWAACPAEAFEDAIPDLGDALRCSRIELPLDHSRPALGATQNLLVRITAGNPRDRKGTLWVEPGGPAVNAADQIVRNFAGWRAVPLQGDDRSGLRQIADAFDVVYLLPRELTGASAVNCTGLDGTPVEPALENPDDDAAWSRLGAEALRVARACSTAGAFASTWQRVRDLDTARASLGEARLNLYGVSYGAWIASQYAATFPQATGRLLLDSSVDIGNSRSGNYAETTRGRQQALLKMGVEPAARRHEFWQLGDTEASIWRQLEALPFRLRHAWAFKVVFQHEILAALRVGELYGLASPQGRGRDDMTVSAQQWHYSPYDRVDDVARQRALDLVSVLPADGRQPVSLPMGVNGPLLAVICNDSAWPHTGAQLRERARDERRTAAFWFGEDVVIPWACHHWQRTPHAPPSLDNLRQLPPFVMLHLQGDLQTPLWSAEEGAFAFPNARLVVTLDAKGHTVLNEPYACPTDIAARYLLTGATPTTSRTYCVPTKATPVPRSEL